MTDAATETTAPEAGAEKLKLGVLSLGCPKNLVDTEVLLGKAAQQDYVICADPEDAEVVVVNTCSFIDQARDESFAAIEEVVRWKKAGKVKNIVVSGCLAQRYGEAIRERVPEVDTIIGMSEYQSFGSVLEEISAGRRAAAEEATSPWRTLVSKDANYDLQPQTGRLRVTPGHYGYLKISEGCSNACTFCAIPNFRGLFRSKPRDMVLAEARELTDSGASELNIISQDTTHYGIDLEGETWQTGLAKLLAELERLDTLRWVRLLYAYPGHVSDELMTEMARNPKVVPYLDMPIQHINSRILKRMGRRHTREETCELLTRLRATIPGLVLRTTFIVGFPGETEEEFEELVEFVREFKFERVGVFPYSTEEGTSAGERFEDDIPDEVKADRVDRLMSAQQLIARDWAESMIDQTLEVVVEEPVVGEQGPMPGLYLGRTLYDAPEVDPIILLSGPEGIAPGTFAEATITGSRGYDLEGLIEPLDV